MLYSWFPEPVFDVVRQCMGYFRGRSLSISQGTYCQDFDTAQYQLWTNRQLLINPCQRLYNPLYKLTKNIILNTVSCYLDLCWIVISTACHEYSSIQAHDSKMIMVEPNSMLTSLSATMRQTQKYMGKIHHQSLVSRQRLQDRLDSFCQDQK